MKIFLSIGVLFLLLIFMGVTSAQLISQAGSKAPVVTVAQILEMQNNEEWNNRYVIVDVRAQAETDVSLIPGAITQAEFERASGQHQGKVVVVYCTVGYRSGIYATQLNTKGWNAYNYKGSILDWCESQQPLVTTDGRETKRVHTYSSRYTVADGYHAVN